MPLCALRSTSLVLGIALYRASWDFFIFPNWNNKCDTFTFNRNNDILMNNLIFTTVLNVRMISFYKTVILTIWNILMKIEGWCKSCMIKKIIFFHLKLEFKSADKFHPVQYYFILCIYKYLFNLVTFFIQGSPIW